MSTHRTTLLAREEIAEGTMAFRLRKPEGFEFKPGQAIDVVLPTAAPDEQGTRHTFSIVSAPFQDHLVAFHPVTAAMHRRTHRHFHRIPHRLSASALVLRAVLTPPMREG